MAVSMLKVTQARPNQLLGNSDRDTKVALAVWCLPRSTRPTGEAGQICGQQTQSSVVGITATLLEARCCKADSGDLKLTL